MTATLGQFSQWLSQYYSELSLMLMATILVVYGDVINKQAKALVSSWHFVFGPWLSYYFAHLGMV